jgi:GTP cyclohydrolase I
MSLAPLPAYVARANAEQAERDALEQACAELLDAQDNNLTPAQHERTKARIAKKYGVTTAALQTAYDNLG